MSTPHCRDLPFYAGSPVPLFVLIFKSCLWLNGLGVVLALALALGVLPFSLPPYWLRLPLTLFLAGILLACVGLLWSGLTHGSIMRRRAAGQAARAHWLPALFAVVCHGLSIMIFCAGCWATLGMSSVSHYYDETHMETTPQAPRMWPR